MLQSVWVRTGEYDFECRLIDPEAYRDMPVHERNWRIATGCNHDQYVQAYSGMLKRFAARLLQALEPAKYLALPPSRRADLEAALEAEVEANYAREQREQIQAECRALMARIRKRAELKVNARSFALVRANDRDYIRSMFALYERGRSRLL